MSPVFRHGRLRLYLLKLLDESPRHGYEVIRLLQDRFMGVYAPSPGTIYPRLARLEEEGLVTHDEADGRKVYRITDKGREELRNRSDDLSELEDEITASVRDIAREVTEDVRETVRNLREELTFAARDMHRRGAAAPRNSAAPPRTSQPGQQAPPRRHGSSAWDEALHEDARDEDTAHEDAQQQHKAQGQEARGQEARGQEARGQEAQHEETQRDQARREQAGPGQDEAGRAHGTRPGADEAGQARSGRPGWSWPPGGSGWADPGAYRDLEQLARRFSRELRAAATQAHAVSEDAVGDLRTILDDALDRIKAEVFGAPDASRPDGATRTGDHGHEDHGHGDPR
jgi:DNA-binding PadR family transcriptional regulator